jgi:hypothetical protein
MAGGGANQRDESSSRRAWGVWAGEGVLRRGPELGAGSCVDEPVSRRRIVPMRPQRALAARALVLATERVRADERDFWRLLLRDHHRGVDRFRR